MRGDGRVIVTLARASVHQGAQHVDAEENEHDADAQLQGMCHSVGHLITQQQDADARDQQGKRVAQTPRGADQQRTQQAATLRRDR